MVDLRVPARARTGSNTRTWLPVALAIVVAAWGGNHFTPLLSLYREREGYSALVVDLLLAFYVIGMIPGFLLAGPLSDRHGRRPVMFVGLAFSLAASIVLATGAGSVPVLMVGRLLAGASVAIAMVVGSSWVKELSAAAGAGATGARRASLSLTVGLGVGAAVSGVLAQWGPVPTVLPYLVQIAAVVVAAAVLLRAPETRARERGAAVRSLLGDLGVPRASRGRFVRVVLPTAPWVFAAATLAYAVLPAVVGDRVGPDRIAFATLLTVVTLASGTGIQTLMPRLAPRMHGRELLVGLGLLVVGAVVSAVETHLRSPWLAIALTVVLGVSFGMLMLAGLTAIQGMAGPDDLAGVTGIYYSLTYVGFTLPVVLAAVAPVAAYGSQLVVMAGLAVACGVIAAVGMHRPASPVR